MILCLETSSLVKVYVVEAGSEDVRALARRAALVTTSVVAYLEVRAAFARRRRDRTLRPADFARLKRDFDADWPTYVTVEVTAAICRGQATSRSDIGCERSTASTWRRSQR